MVCRGRCFEVEFWIDSIRRNGTQIVLQPMNSLVTLPHLLGILDIFGVSP